MRFLGVDGSWRGPSYSQLADRVLRMVTAVQDEGLAGRRVGIVAGRAVDFVVQFFALVAAGSTCVPLPSPATAEDPVAHGERMRRLLAMSQPDAVVAPRDAEAGDAAAAAAVHLPALADLDAVSPGTVAEPGPDHLTLVQFSSGTTGAPHAVRVPRRILDAQLTAMQDWLQLGAEDRVASWVPFHHDMGLVGTMMENLATQTDLMLMSPRQFLKRPQEWLWCFGRLGATLGAAPAFGYLHACNKVTKEDLEGCDFSRWRTAIVGAEPLRAGQLGRIIDVLAPYGFQSKALSPAYGLAEGTLAVTGVRPADEPGVLPAGWRPDAEEGVIPALKVREESIQANQVVGSGSPIDGVEISIRNLEGHPVPDGWLGEIWVGGSSLADGYEPPDAESWPPGWFKTGDAGCVVKGQLFVFGRLSDSFQVAGEIIFAEQAEQRIQELVPDAGMLVVVPSRFQGAGLTVVAESSRSWTPATAEQLRRTISELFTDIETDLVVVERGVIPRTSSGKPRRRKVWRRFVAAS